MVSVLASGDIKIFFPEVSYEVPNFPDFVPFCSFPEEYNLFSIIVLPQEITCHLPHFNTSQQHLKITVFFTNRQIHIYRHCTIQQFHSMDWAHEGIHQLILPTGKTKVAMELSSRHF